MYALTVCQPYASALIERVKRFENRDWKPPTARMNVPILLHAGVSFAWMRNAPEEHTAFCTQKDEAGRIIGALPFGALLGRIIIRDVWTPEGARRVEPDQAIWIIGKLCWRVEVLEKFALPIPWRGALGFWKVDDAELERAREAIAAPGGTELTQTELTQRRHGAKKKGKAGETPALPLEFFGEAVAHG